ncbi:hypothetical protein [Paraburkholderia tropica]|uniref:hypothetical protein n=1 Tax=Paraburkholderia tropica TaxID=92647 RepID=UPI002AB30B96|nr:hypothetical protein [Paraburkholderia tropica]
MTVLLRVSADCLGNSFANPWAFRDHTGQILGYSLPNEDRVAVYRIESGKPAEFVHFEPETPPSASRAQWLQWHRNKEAREAADTRPRRPFDDPSTPDTTKPATGLPERSALMSRADYGMQKHQPTRKP